MNAITTEAWVLHIGPERPEPAILVIFAAGSFYFCFVGCAKNSLPGEP